MDATTTNAMTDIAMRPSVSSAGVVHGCDDDGAAPSAGNSRQQ